MEDTVVLLLNHYVGDDFFPSRQVRFVITKDCLEDYLRETEDERTVSEFLATYDSDESEVIYGYAADDGRILSDEIIYSEAFLESYHDFIKRMQAFCPGRIDEQIIKKESYYWQIYAFDQTVGGCIYGIGSTHEK